jgi:hypothetical protein
MAAEAMKGKRDSNSKARKRLAIIRIPQEKNFLPQSSQRAQRKKIWKFQIHAFLRVLRGFV